VKLTSSRLAEVLQEFVGDIDPTSKKGLKRRAILAIATQMFAENGYRKTNMDELAGQVGVAKGTLYLYFPKKIDLLFACAALEKLRWVPELVGILEGDEPAADRLKQWLIACLLLPSRSPLMCRLLEDEEMTAVMADYPPALRLQNEDSYAQLMQPLLDELAGGGHRWSAIELRDRAHVLGSVSYLAPMLRHESLRNGMSAERFAAILADFIVDGIRPRPQPRRSISKPDQRSEYRP
jgi:AcrR family transcriptional regulator